METGCGERMSILIQNTDGTIPIATIGMPTGTISTHFDDPQYVRYYVSSSQEVQTPSGTNLKIKQTKNISPKLYFSYVKSKLTISEQKELASRLVVLYDLMREAKEIKQQAYYEKLMHMAVICVREQEIAVAGYEYYLFKNDIYKFIHKVRDQTVKLTNLENFTRNIPSNVRDELKIAQDKKLFDSFWILHNDPLKGSEGKTQKDKIVEKDPILFGCVDVNKNVFFYLTDWVDEYCDLTLDEFTNKMAMQARTRIVKSLDTDKMKEIREAVDKWDKDLKDTSQENWKKKALEAEKAEEKQQLAVIKKMEPKSFWTKLRELFK